ncbi:MAG: M14 family zinc carboxypeptidase [Candidatus Brocadiia bacterium]
MVDTEIPHGNVCGVSIVERDSLEEIRFTPHPHGGPECLWFCFRLRRTEGDIGQVRIVLEHFETILGGNDVLKMRPVMRPAGGHWQRLDTAGPREGSDGQISACWELMVDAPECNIATCYPYGPPHISCLLEQTDGYWKSEDIGVTQKGRKIARLRNETGSDQENKPGIYIIARQHSGEAPGSWVLDGLLRQLAQKNRQNLLVWTVPFANLDGIIDGDYGKDNFPYDINRAWGNPPMRHETLVIMRDIDRWISRCKPVFGLDLHAPGACDDKGLYAHMPDRQEYPQRYECALPWAKAMGQVLGAEFAAAEFPQSHQYASRWTTPSFSRFCFQRLNSPGLCVEVPYGLTRQIIMTKRKYREAGGRIADALTELISRSQLQS